MIQGSAEWLRARCGKATASRIGDIMAMSKDGSRPLKTHEDYLMELVCERLTGQAAEHYVSSYMVWGLEKEDDALLAYQFYTGRKVESVGFYDHPTIPMSGASPDGLVGDEGLVEVKCPTTGTHVASLLGSRIATGHALQMQWQMACTGRQWCDYVSFDPRLPDHLQLKIRRVERDAALISEVEAAVAHFLTKVSGKVAQLDALKPLENAA